VVNPLERLFTGRYHLHYQDSLGGRIEGRLSDLGGYWRSAVVENLPTKLHILDTPRRFLALGSGEATTIQRVHQPRIGTYRTSHGDLYVVLATTDPKITRSFSVTAGERPSLRWGGDWIPGWPGGEGRLPLPGGKADVPWFVDLPYGDRFPDSTASFSVGTPVPLGLDTHVVTREATGQTRLIAVRVNGGHGPAVIHDFVPHDAVPRDQGVPQGRAPWRLAAIGEGAGRIGLSPLAGPSHSLLHNHPLPLPPSQLELPVPSKWPAYFYAKPVIDFGVGGVRAVSIWELAAHLFAGRGQVSLELRGIEVAVGLSLSYNPVLVAQTMLWPLRAVDLLGQTGVVPWGTPVNDLAQAFTRATGGGVTWQWNPELAYVLATQVDLNRPPQPAGGPHVPLPPGHDWQPRREHGQIVGYVDSTAVVLPVRSPVTGEIVEWTEQPVPGGTP
jgi:hypothetical protein